MRHFKLTEPRQSFLHHHTDEDFIFIVIAVFKKFYHESLGMYAKMIRVKDDQLLIRNDPTHSFPAIDSVHDNALGPEFNISIKQVL